jgi:hypothetical protein
VKQRQQRSFIFQLPVASTDHLMLIRSITDAILIVLRWLRGYCITLFVVSIFIQEVSAYMPIFRLIFCASCFTAPSEIKLKLS